MKAFLILASAALQSIAVTALPVTLTGSLLSARDLDERSPANPFAAAAKALTGGGGNGESVPEAASAFAGDVAIVSSSLNGMGQTMDPKQISAMARKAFVAETDEEQHRAVLDDAAGRDARQANQKIVDNTPIVLDGLESMMKNPSMANVMRQLSKVESARNANILPSITQLSNSALDNTGSNQQQKTFDPTTGTQDLKQLMASGGTATNGNAGTATGNTAAKGSTAATTGKGKGDGAAATTGKGKGAGAATGAAAGSATTQKGGAGTATGNTAAKGSSPAATTGKAKGAGGASNAGTATQKGGADAAGDTAAKASSPAASGTPKGKGTAAASGNAASKGGAAAKGGAGAGADAANTKGGADADAGTAATTGNASTKGAGGGTNGAGAAAADEEEDN